MSDKKKGGWSTIKGGGDYGKAKNWEDSVKLAPIKEKKKEYVTVRYVESPTSGARMWVAFTNKEGKESGFYAPNFAWNSETESYESGKANLAERAGIRSGLFYAANAIVREYQNDKPSKVKPEKPNKKGFKDKDDPGYSPMRVVVLPAGQAEKIKKLCALNKHKIDGKTVSMDIADPKYGMDLEIMFDPDAEGAAMYDIQKGEKTALTKEERAYLKYDLSIIPNYVNSKKEGDLYYEDRKKLEKDFERLGLLDGGKKKDDDEDDDIPEDDDSDDEDTSKKKKKSKSDDEDDFDDEEDSDDDDSDGDDEDDEEEEKSSKKKSKKKSDEDDDSDDDEESEDDDEDSESDDEDSDDSDGDDEDADSDDDDEPVKKKKKKSKSDDEDDEEESEDDDEEDEPKKKKKKSKDEDDDDSEDDEDDDW